MKKTLIQDYVRKNPPKGGEYNYDVKVAEMFKTTRGYVSNMRREMGIVLIGEGQNLPAPGKTEYTPEELVETDKKRKEKESEEKLLSRKYEVALEENENLRREISEAFSLKKDAEPVRIKKSAGGKSESTAFLVASDWHVEEEVVPESVNFLNKFNLDIADKRINFFFANSLKLLTMHAKEAGIKEVVLCLLGDFFTGSIHEEFMETNQMAPGDAAWTVQNYLLGGIQFFLKESDFKFTVVCHSGNHGRMTQKIHYATESGNSLETYLYRNLASKFEKEPRVKFVVSEGYHSYLDVYDYVVRIHHGHMIRYGGGVGGIFIPAYKAISQWNKGKKADLDVFGHFHQRKDGGIFISNGSLIGYNAYAIGIKADFEEPQQTFFLVNSVFGKTEVAPVILKEV